MAIQDLWRLDGKVAVVVGGSGGIGAALAQGLAESGARVAVVSTSRAKAEAVVAGLVRDGHEASGYQCDVTKTEEVAAAAAAVVARYSQVDVLVNCAGINLRRPAEEVTEEDWLRVLDVNLIGAFRVAQAFGRHMIPRRTGKIVTISSIRGIVAYPGGYTAYCASKGGVNMLTRQLATEWAKHGINVNAVAPTYIETPLIEPLLTNEATRKTIVGRIPLGRVGQPRDLVGAVLFLVTPASDFVTGEVLYVDGGSTATEFYSS